MATNSEKPTASGEWAAARADGVDIYTRLRQHVATARDAVQRMDSAEAFAALDRIAAIVRGM